MKKKILALVMSCALFASMLPTTIVAAVAEDADAQTEDTVTTTDLTDDVVIFDKLSAGDGSCEIEIIGNEEAASVEEAEVAEPVYDDTGVEAGPAENIIVEAVEAADGDAAEADKENVEETDEQVEADEEDVGEADSKDTLYKVEAGGVIVEVTVPAGALPDNAELAVKRFAEDSADYREAAEAIHFESTDENGMAALDISFMADGMEVEPAGPVKVSIDVAAILPADADKSTLEVQHLEETGAAVNPVVVANESAATEGTIDAGRAVAKFSVDSFSSFTITWAGSASGGNSTEITVYIYDINGLGIYDSDEQVTYTWTSGTHTIEELISEHISGKIGDGYTFAYATAQYLTTSAMGGNVTTIGGESDPVISVGWNGSSYTVTTGSRTTTVSSSSANEFYINLYFSVPMVEISVTNADITNHTVSLAAETQYFQNSNIIYEWEITSGEEYASITGNGADATVTWNTADRPGDTLTVQVTATSQTGEIAIDTYELEYGMQQVTYTVYYNSGRTLASGAHLAIYDENGKLVSNGEADSNGRVTIWIVAGTTYRLEASYTASSGSGMGATRTHYAYEDTGYVYVGDGSDDTTIYLEASDAKFYEHIDVKLSIAEEDAGYSDILSNVDYVRVYDEEGELVYQSAEMVHNAGTNDYNVLFADADGNEGSNPHSIAFYDTYSIEIAYEVSYTYTDLDGNAREYTESYVARLDKNSVYADGEYYSYNGTNAYQLYNEMYGTSYSAASFAAAVTASAAGESGGLAYYNGIGIDISGQTYFFVAASLCDTKDSSNMAGLDLALGVNSLRMYSSTTWNFDVQKTLKNSGADADEFSFGLYSATVSDSLWSINVSDSTDNSLEFTLSNGEMIMPDGSTESVTNMNGFFSFDYDSTMVGRTQAYYFVLAEDAGNDENIAYSDTVYGIIIEVTLNDASDMTNVTIKETPYILTESDSGSASYRTFTQGAEYEGSTDGNGFTIFPFENAYRTGGGLNLGITKTISGRESTEKTFAFALYEADEEFAYSDDTLIDTESTTGTLTENVAQSVIFDTTGVNYTEDGIYYYVIKETTDSGSGWTCDGTEYHVSVTAVGDGGKIVPVSVTYTYVDSEGTTQSGTLTADEDDIYGISGDNTLSFTNTYDASGNLTLAATKNYTGATLTANQFNFTITETTTGVDEDALYTGTGTNDADGNITFTPEITYTLDDVGTHTYRIEEVNGYAGGVTYDDSVIIVTVVVTDNEDGTLSTNVTADGEEVTPVNDSYNVGIFENSYGAEPVSVQFVGVKYLTNSTGTNKVFTFELYETDSSFEISGEAIDTETTTGADAITFDEITYEEDGTYYYVIREKTPDEAEGWTIDPTVYNITVEIADDGLGQLVATVMVNGDEVTGEANVYGGFDFTNAYAAEGMATLGVVKSLSGVTETDEEFEFTLYDSDSTFTAGSEIETIFTSGTITNSTELNFEVIPYTEAGTYYYVIKETGTAPAGWTLDETEYQVTVTVADNGDGTLTTSVSYACIDGEGEAQTENAAAFTNTYTAAGSLSLTGIKTFIGGTLKEDGFSFTMKDSTGANVGDVTMDAKGTITFPTLTYDETDIGGEYTYMITEVNTNDPGLVYDDTTYTVVVSVADNKDGTLDVSYTVNGEESRDIAFTNYQKGILIIDKIFTGLTEDQIAGLADFTITVTNSNGDTVAVLTLDDADEDSAYTWTVNDLPADTYTVTESGYSLDGYEVIAKSAEMEVTDGSDVSVDDTLDWGVEDKVEFDNDYIEVGTITISKYVVAEEDVQKAHEDTEYTVVITASEDADFRWVSVTSDSGRGITPTIDKKTITFTIMEYETVTISGLPAGDYIIEETESDALTGEHFTPIYRIGDAEDENAPTLTVASGSENVVAVEIDNEYPIGTYIMVQKDYNKDKYPEEGFTFKIEALSCDPEAEDVTISAKDMPMPDNDTVMLTESGETGYFGNIVYEHLGTYYYMITETAGKDNMILYDGSVHYIKVVVASEAGTHVETTDEYEARADVETEAYKDLEYTEAGIVTAEFSNTALEELTIEKEVSGNPGDTTQYEFEITLTNPDGTPFEGTVTMAGVAGATGLKRFASSFVKRMGDTESTVEFVDGKATVTVTAGEKATLMIPHGVTCQITETTTGADTTTVYDGDKVIATAKGTESEATAEVGTIAESTQVRFVNSYRGYFPIDEEIVTDEDDIFDKDAWVKNEAVNEYNAIEIEMTTNLPVVTAYDLTNGEFTMNFHEVLDHELVLDEDTADFTVYIAQTAISPVYYRIAFDDDTGDDCNFHVDVDLTALYNDGVVTEDMLDGDTEITIFFFADLEGTGLNGSYTSTVWYDIYDGEEWLYTSNQSVVAVYTYEIKIIKYDASTLEGDDYAGSALADATLGIYYDEACENPVSRNDAPYTAVSDEDGTVIFYGLADGTYYVKELQAPARYELSDEVLEIVLGEDLNDNGYMYEGEFANTPATVDVEGSKTWSDENDALGARPESITIRLLSDGEEIDCVTVTADDGWTWSFTELPQYDADGSAITYAITEDEVEHYTAAYEGYDVTNTYLPEDKTEPDPKSDNGGNGGTGGNGGKRGNTGSTGNTQNPAKAQNSKTADADLPVLPIAGCFAAVVLIAAALFIRRRESNK